MKDCLICMDVMKGYVILECGHECCAKCFAQHSRINNTCPFCRKAYAPPVNKTNQVYEAEAPSFEEINSAESIFFLLTRDEWDEENLPKLDDGLWMKNLLHFKTF